jgi:hypothetical protein
MNLLILEHGSVNGDGDCTYIVQDRLLSQRPLTTVTAEELEQLVHVVVFEHFTHVVLL